MSYSKVVHTFSVVVTQHSCEGMTYGEYVHIKGSIPLGGAVAVARVLCQIYGWSTPGLFIKRLDLGNQLTNLTAHHITGYVPYEGCTQEGCYHEYSETLNILVHNSGTNPAMCSVDGDLFLSPRQCEFLALLDVKPEKLSWFVENTRTLGNLS